MGVPLRLQGMKRLFWTLSFLWGFCPCLVAGPLSELSPLSEVLKEDVPPVADLWLQVRMDGAACGYEHDQIFEGRFQGEPCLIVEVESTTQASLDDQAVSMGYAFIGAVSLDLACLRHASLFQRSSERRVLRGVREKSRYRIQSDMGGSTWELSIPLAEEATYPFFLQSWLKTHPDPGRNGKVFRTYDDEFVRQVDYVFSSPSMKSGRKSLNASLTQLDELPVLFKMGRESRLKSISSPSLGLEQKRVSPRKAMTFQDDSSEIESLLPFQGPTILPSPCERALFEMAWKDEASPRLVPETEYQSVLDPGTERSSGVQIQVNRVPIPEGGDVPSTQDFLSSGPLIQSEDPEIVKLAQDLAGSQGPAEAAETYLNWTMDHIGPSNPEGSMLSAKEVLASRRGDCTECASLYAALCRARGIPCRICAGLVIVEGLCCMHAWNEIWLKGRWVPVDAALGQFPAEPVRVLLALEEEDDPFLSLLNLRSYRLSRGLSVRWINGG